MKNKKVFTVARRLSVLVLALVLVLRLTVSTYAAQIKNPFKEIKTEHNGVSFTYELFLTDQNGESVINPRTLTAGDTLNVEIRLEREQYNESQYDSYGIEFRLLTRGLTYNNDGASLRETTDVGHITYMDGDSVGFAWYDMTREGEAFANPVLASSWSYTVEDPSAVNITVPVALIFVTGEDDEFIPVGNARLFLDPNGGKIVGKDVSGEYPSGKAVVLPNAKFGDYNFDGWSDGIRLYPAGTEYVVSGVVTLTAQWSGLVRDRYVTFILNGGELDGEDPSGFYADGEVIVLPDITREGYRFIGWNDGVNVYQPGDKYEVYNTVNLAATWELIMTDPSAEDTTKPDGTEKPGVNPYTASAVAVGGGAGLGLLWWLLLLWKRTLVKYSLITGDVSLYFKNGNIPAEVDVVLYDGAKEYHLNRSGRVEVRHRLRFIKNVTNMSIADIEPGKYKGKLLVHEDGKIRTKKCRIKVLDKKLNKRFRK